MVQNTETKNEIEQKYLTFSLGEEEYGVPVNKVTGIVQVDELIPVPHTATYFIGLLDVRGKTIPAIDLKAKLGLSKGSESGEHAIIIEFEDYRIALLVDGVHSVNKFPPESIDAGPPSIKDTTGQYMIGIGKLDDQFVILINLNSLFDTKELKAFTNT